MRLTTFADNTVVASANHVKVTSRLDGAQGDRQNLFHADSPLHCLLITQGAEQEPAVNATGGAGSELAEEVSFIAS